MASLAGFNANDHEPNEPRVPIPEGDYEGAIVSTDWQDTKAGTGKFLIVEVQVLSGDYKGRKVFDRLNLQNPNPDAVRIAQGDLSAICRAVGVMTPRDSVELHNIPLIVTVKLKPRADTGELTNEIKGYAAKPKAEAGAPPPSSDVSSPWG